MERCEECGFEYASQDAGSIPDRLRTLGGRYRAPLTRFLPGEDGDALVRTRTATGGWSALEYACHLRDVLQVQRERVGVTLVEEVPTYVAMGREERVIEHRYNEQDPATVAAEVAAAAEATAATFEALTPDGWGKTGIYGYPEPRERSLLWLGQHTVHEAHHHLLDVGRTLRVVRGR